MDYHMFLPVIKTIEQQKIELGAQLELGRGQSISNHLPYISPNSVIQMPVIWEAIEPVFYDPPQYINLEWLDEATQLLAGHKVILGVKSSPSWAQSITGYPCSPPKTDCYPYYLRLLKWLSEKYHPFAVEIWNEPDVRPEQVGQGVYYMGCWGTDENSGHAYGQLLKYVYPVMHQECPNVKILGGALMLDLNAPLDFLKGLLEETNGDYFDFLSYHGYEFYPYWTPGTCTLIDKANIIHSYLLIGHSGFGQMNNLPLWVTETSLLSSDGGAVFEQQKADYLNWLLDKSNLIVRHGIMGINAYTLSGNGWENSDLVKSGIKQPAWYIWDNYLRN